MRRTTVVRSARLCRDRQGDEAGLAVGVVGDDVVRVGHASEFETGSDAESFFLDHHRPSSAVEAKWSNETDDVYGENLELCIPLNSLDPTKLDTVPEHCTCHLQRAVRGSEKELRQDGGRTISQWS